MAGLTTSKGYGYEHQRERRKWEPVVARGEAICTRCSEPIVPGSSWDLDHSDDRSGYRGASHTSCNRSAGGRRGAEVTNMARQLVVREW